MAHEDRPRQPTAELQLDQAVATSRYLRTGQGVPGTRELQGPPTNIASCGLMWVAGLGRSKGASGGICVRRHKRRAGVLWTSGQ